jgi:hypothetical protein
MRPRDTPLSRGVGTILGTANRRLLTERGMEKDDVPTETAPSSIWPRATEAARARWATQAVERYLHMARIIMTRAAAWPAGEGPFPAHTLDLARQLYDAIARRLDALSRPPRPDGLGAHTGARPVSPTHTSPGGRPLKAGPLDRTSPRDHAGRGDPGRSALETRAMSAASSTRRS